MQGTLEFIKLLQFFLALVFVTIYSFAFIIIKPFLINHKRPISTFLLKITYVIYLGILLTCVFLFIFYASSETEHKLTEEVFFTLISFFFIPNIGILLRRNFIKYRNIYNYSFTLVNIVITLFIILKLNAYGWFLS